MNLLEGSVKKTYRHFLAAAFGSAMISSVYSIVDMAVVGQYQGPEGTAALAVVAPIWNIIYSLGLLMGIGGSVLFSRERGAGRKKTSDEYFTLALLGAAGVALICHLAVLFGETGLLTLFGATDELMGLAKAYLMPVKVVVPVFLFTQFLSAFLRNDGAPGLATAAVLIGGVFNVFGDVFFVFSLNMGITGAGLATAMGAVITLVIMLTHFFSKKNTLALAKPTKVVRRLRAIVVTGFSTFFSDVAMGILTMLYNRTITAYLGTDALSVYGVIVNVSTIVQCMGYSAGQAAQPLFSANYGAHNTDRIKDTLKYGTIASGVFGVLSTLVMMLVPMVIIRIFMTPTEAIAAIAPGIMRTYGLSFILLVFNIFSTYYFQSMMKAGISMKVSVMRGLAVSGILIVTLPKLCGGSAMWLAMPVTEVLTCLYVVRHMRKVTREL